MDYFDRLEAETHHLYDIANKARSKGFDVETETEVPLAKDLAERVEGLVGPEGVAQRIKELEKIEEVSGFLVGGASLNTKAFLKIIEVVEGQ